MDSCNNKTYIASMINRNKPLLSICIPTYNRSDYLKKTIESIVIQDEFKNHKVEIVISDNASTDNTRKVCQEFEKKFSNFHYFRNEFNIYDKNFPLVISLANGVYRKLSNDSHIYLQKAMYCMCDLIERHIDIKPCIYWAIDRFTTNIKIGKESKFNFEDFIVVSGEHITNIISFGMWEDDYKYLDSINDEKNCMMKLWQAYTILKLASSHRDIIIYSNILVKEQTVKDKEVSYNVFEIFHDNYLKILSKYKLSNKIIEEIEKRMLFDTFYHWRLKWDDDKSYLKFNKELFNLPNEIKNTYGGKKYYVIYLMKVNIAEFCRKIKRTLFI